LALQKECISSSRFQKNRKEAILVYPFESGGI